MSQNTARNHHYLSQFYLKGFTDGRSKKSKLAVLDCAEAKSFETKPRNVGSIRDFNRVDVEGVDPNAIEKALSGLEGSVATAIKHIEESQAFCGENRTLVLNLIASMAIRNPAMRDNMRGFRVQIAERIMDLALASEERWNRQVEQMKAAGYDVGDVSYESIKEFHESKRYVIEVAREFHIDMEFKVIEAVLPYLSARGWKLLIRDTGAGAFITSDRPVVLFWNNPESIPPLHRHSPGYGMKDTTVYLPLSQDCALVGLFNEKDAVLNADARLIAHFNTVMLHLGGSQIYAPKLTFQFVGSDGELLTGQEALKHLNEARNTEGGV